MVTIFYTKIKETFLKADLDKMQHYFNDHFTNRVLLSRSIIYINRRFTFMLLMINICKDLNIPICNLITLYHNKYGKLIMPKYNIVISYSGNYIFCLITTMKIGLDVEYINKRIPKNYFTILNKIANTQISNYKEFYHEWTKIESIIKYYNHLSLKDVLFNKLDLNTYKLDTLYITSNNKYLIALSGKNMYTLKKNIRTKYLPL